MTPKDFVKKYYKNAKDAGNKYGVNADSILTQAAIESAWGEAVFGNSFFGQKDFDGVNGNEQLLRTIEYNKSAMLTPKQVGLESITNIEAVIIEGVKMYKYIGKAYFKKYKSAEDCFSDHIEFLIRNKRYKKALLQKDNSKQFLIAIADAGYAQNPNYKKLLLSTLSKIQLEILTYSDTDNA